MQKVCGFSLLWNSFSSLSVKVKVFKTKVKTENGFIKY